MGRMRNHGPRTTPKHSSWWTCFTDLGSRVQKRFKCVACDFTAKTRVVVQRHYNIHLVDKPFVCHEPGCNFKTRHHAALYTHRKSHDQSTKCHQCDFPGCNYKARYKGRVREHQKWHQIGKPFSCVFTGCTFRAKTQQGVDRHSVVHDPARQKTFQCSLCENKFYRRSDLEIHLARHTKERPYKCPTCPYSSQFPSILQWHLCPNNPQAGRRKKPQLRPFAIGKLHKCSQCEFSSDYVSKVKKHEDVVHGFKSLVVTPIRQNILRCKFCEFSVRGFNSMERHMRNHTKEKPFACDVGGCNFRSKWSGNVYAHKKIVHWNVKRKQRKGKCSLAVNKNGSSPVNATKNLILSHCFVTLKRISVVQL